MPSSVLAADILKRNQRYIIMATICVIASALAAFAVDALQLYSVIQTGAYDTARFAEDAQSLIAERARTLILVSILTAIVEELIFRGLLLRALLKKLSEFKTILITSAIFAVLHMIPIGATEIDLSDPDGKNILILASISLLLKGMQAFVFGMVMAKIVMRDGSLPIVMALHALFDAIYFAIPVLSTGNFPETYLAASPDQLLALAFSTLILVPAMATHKKRIK